FQETGRRDLFAQKYCSIHLCFLGKRKLILFLLFSTHHGSLSPCKPSPAHQKPNSSTVKWEWEPGVHSDGNKKHRKGWITGIEAGLQLIHALTPSFLLSFWSSPRLSTSPHGQNLTYTPVLPCALLVSSTSASSASPWERPALGLGSSKPKISTLEIVSCILWSQTSFSLGELKQSGLSAPYSLLPCLHGCTNCSQIDLRVKLHLEHRPREPLLLPSHSWRSPRECPSRWKNQGLLPPFPDITTPRAPLMAVQVRANPETSETSKQKISPCAKLSSAPSAFPHLHSSSPSWKLSPSLPRDKLAEDMRSVPKGERDALHRLSLAFLPPVFHTDHSSSSHFPQVLPWDHEFQNPTASPSNKMMEA
ncbi:LOW QUALITY PROTEIN: hypothetical protein Nmel_014519, partial [Mimus melanotis]